MGIAVICNICGTEYNSDEERCPECGAECEEENLVQELPFEYEDTGWEK